MLLVDTSVWVDHFRRGNTQLMAALEGQEIMTHPFVIGELSCGSIANRDRVLDLLRELPGTIVATDEEALDLIERRRLMGRGLGYVDVHLLAASLLTPPVRLWTLDAPLGAAAARLGVAAR